MPTACRDENPRTSELEGILGIIFNYFFLMQTFVKQELTQNPNMYNRQMQSCHGG